MATSIEDRVREAVQEGRKARSAYYAAIELPDEQELGPPAAETVIQKLETHVGRPLPPSYRIFLTLHNGWRQTSGGTDLLRVEEILEGPIANSIEAWKKQAAKSGDAVAARSLVVGYSRITATRLLLDPEAAAADGEWPLIQHHKDEEAEYSSFLAWLEESAAEFRELAEDEKAGS